MSTSAAITGVTRSRRSHSLNGHLFIGSANALGRSTTPSIFDLSHSHHAMLVMRTRMTQIQENIRAGLLGWRNLTTTMPN